MNALYVGLRNTDEMVQKFSQKHIMMIAGLEDKCCTCNSDENESQDCCDCVSNSLDNHCGAELMGRCRLQRLHAYFQYLHVYYGAEIGELDFSIVDVPDTAHNSCIIQDERVQESMFGMSKTTVEPDYETTSNANNLLLGVLVILLSFIM